MRFVPFLAVLGVSFARGVSLDQRDLESEDASETIGDNWSNVVDRHDNGFFAGQYPLAQTDDDSLAELLAPPGPHHEEEGIDTIDHIIIDPAETTIAQNPPPSHKDDDQDTNTPAILKRDFFTWRVPFYLPGFQTSTRPVDVPVTITLGTSPPVTLTKTLTGPVTVTVTVTAITSITSFYNVFPTAFAYTVALSTLTDEFLTFTYLTFTRQITLLVLLGVGAYTTVTSPVTVTVLEGVGPTVTVTETFFRPRTELEATYIPYTTRTVAIPDFRTLRRTRRIVSVASVVTTTRATAAGVVTTPAARVVTTATTPAAKASEVLLGDSPKPWISRTSTVWGG